MASANLYFNCNFLGSTGSTIEAIGSPQQTVTIQPTTGIFAFDDPTKHGVPVYGMASVTDGASNTIAYSEHLVGGGTTSFSDMRRVSLEGVTQVGSVAIQDPGSISTQVVQAMSACSTFASQNKGNSSAGDTDGGVGWMIGFAGATLFNTITPPNNPQYAWASCEATTGVTFAHAGFINATSNYPGGRTTASSTAAFTS